MNDLVEQKSSHQQMAHIADTLSTTTEVPGRKGKSRNKTKKGESCITPWKGQTTFWFKTSSIWRPKSTETSKLPAERTCSKWKQSKELLLDDGCASCEKLRQTMPPTLNGCERLLRSSSHLDLLLRACELGPICSQFMKDAPYFKDFLHIWIPSVDW